MLTTGLLLLILAASSFAQNKTPPLGQVPTALGDGSCSLLGANITCTCRPGKEVLNLTASSIEGSGDAKALNVSGCTSVTLSLPPQRQLHSLLVENCGSATFQENASPLLRHLQLVNVSQLAFQGPTFRETALETVLLDGVRVSTLPAGAFAILNKIQNVTFRDVHFSAIQQGAVEISMVKNSEFTILRSNLLGVEKSGIAVTGVANFTLHESNLTTVADSGLQLDTAGPVSISDSQLQTAGRVLLALTSGSPFEFVDNVWKNSSLLDVAGQFLRSDIKATVERNTFHCACDATMATLVDAPTAGPLLESNWCDEGLCRAPVPMRVLRSCSNQTELQAACEAALSATAPGEASKPAGVTDSPAGVTGSLTGVTGSPKSAKPSPGTNSAPTAIAVTTALLLMLPAVAARAL